jgi:hypothetical protein
VARSDLIDSLIATYRNLNLAIRPLPDEQVMRQGADGTSLRDLVSGLRNHELRASQQLKLMTLGESAVVAIDDDAPAPSTPDTSVRSMLSEFGTAREAILALVREMPEEEWTRERAGPNGTTTIATFIEQLVAHDKESIQQIESSLQAQPS